MQGLRTALSKDATKEVLELFRKENFTGPFTTLDVHRVCRRGEFISDEVVFRFSRHFASKHFTSEWKKLYVESPAFISSILDVEKMNIQFKSLAYFMKQVDDNKLPTWGQRLTQGQRVLLPISVPLNVHWLLVVMWKEDNMINIEVVDSMYWENQIMQLHERLVEKIVKIIQLMGGVGKTPITAVESVPLQQHKMYHFCGFHVLARIFMESTNQTKNVLTSPDIEKVREYVQYMILSKETMEHKVFEYVDSEEDEFTLE